MLVAAGASVRTVRIVLPEGAEDLTCQVRAGDRVVETQRGRVLEFGCPSSGAETVSCDGSKLEPVDVPLSDICRSKTLKVVPAQTVNGGPVRPRPMERSSGWT